MQPPIERFIALLGGYPERPPLDARLLDVQEGEGHTRRLIEYTAYGEVRVPAFLLLPAGAGPNWLWRWSLAPEGEGPPGRVPAPPVAGLGRALDQDDLIAGIAPRPYLETRGDPWPGRFQAELLRRANARYAALGVPDRLEYVRGDGGHAFPEAQRERAYAWLERWLASRPQPQPA